MLTPSATSSAQRVSPRRTPTLQSAGLAVAAGLVLGAATSGGQTVLGAPWSALANSVAPWSIPAFVITAVLARRSGVEVRRVRVAALIGTALCVSEVVGYYVISSLRGYAPGTLALFWALCGLAAGPVFGAAGWAWARGPLRWRPAAAALVPAVLGADAGRYLLVLHYRGEALLCASLAVLSIALLSRRDCRTRGILAMLLPMLAAGAAGFVVLEQAYRVWTSTS